MSDVEIALIVTGSLVVYVIGAAFTTSLLFDSPNSESAAPVGLLWPFSLLIWFGWKLGRRLRR